MQITESAHYAACSLLILAEHALRYVLFGVLLLGDHGINYLERPCALESLTCDTLFFGFLGAIDLLPLRLVRLALGGLLHSKLPELLEHIGALEDHGGPLNKLLLQSLHLLIE